MFPAILMDLDVGLIPRERFWERRWFYATPSWYYHRPGPLPSLPRLKTDPQFYRLIDPDLQEVCAFLHGHNLLTVPSCQGHFHRPAYFRHVWEELQYQADLIRSTGLSVTDSETDTHCLFRNGRFRLPWSSFSQFHATLEATQEGGYLGVLLAGGQRAVWDRIVRDGYATKHLVVVPAEIHGHCSSLLHIYVNSPTPDEQTRQWQGLTRYLVRRVHQQ